MHNSEKFMHNVDIGTVAGASRAREGRVREQHDAAGHAWAAHDAVPKVRRGSAWRLPGSAFCRAGGARCGCWVGRKKREDRWAELGHLGPAESEGGGE